MEPNSKFDKLETRDYAETAHILSETLSGFPLTHEKIRESTKKGVNRYLVKLLFHGNWLSKTHNENLTWFPSRKQAISIHDNIYSSHEKWRFYASSRTGSSWDREP